MDPETTVYFATQIGELVLGFENQALSSLSINQKIACADSGIDNTPALKRPSDKKSKEAVLRQLEHYFSAAIAFQNISLMPNGTAFQKSVWRELTKIPPGETCTYGQIAKKLDSSARAVGNACRRNPIAIIIPCHRVISATGIGGYAGQTQGEPLTIKRWLLNHEGVQI